jgi:hypothetical protein
VQGTLRDEGGDSVATVLETRAEKDFAERYGGGLLQGAGDFTLTNDWLSFVVTPSHREHVEQVAVAICPLAAKAAAGVKPKGNTIGQVGSCGVPLWRL